MTLPMALIPTVCGAVKLLEKKKSRSPDLNEENLRDIQVLKQEGLEIATEAMQRALSKRVLEMTSNGNFRLKVITDKKAAFDIAQSLYSNENIYSRKIIGKMKSKPVNNLLKRNSRLGTKKGSQKTQQKGRKLRRVMAKSQGRVQKRTITKRGRKKSTKVLSKQNLNLGNKNQGDCSNTECVTRQCSGKDLEENLSLINENQQDNDANNECVTKQCSRKDLEENLSLENKNQQDSHSNTEFVTRRCTRQSKLRCDKEQGDSLQNDEPVTISKQPLTKRKGSSKGKSDESITLKKYKKSKVNTIENPITPPLKERLRKNNQ